MIDIVTWAESKIGFFVDRQWRGGQWVLEPGPIRLASYHADLLRHIFTPDESGRLPYDVIGWCEPAKSGKSAIAGLAGQYMALHGEKNSQVIMASNKQKQAQSLMFASLTYSLEHNPALRIEAGKESVELPNGNEVRAIPSSSRGEAGARFSLALFDELWGYVHTDAERLWSEFKSDPTRQRSLKMALGYAGYLESELWLELLQNGLAGEPVPELAHITNDGGDPACWRNGRTFVFWSHVTRQPWQTDAWKAGLKASLRPAEYQRMVETIFVEGEGDFVDLDAWAACIDPSHRPLLPGAWNKVWIGLDLAIAPGGDDAAAVGIYKENGKAKLAFHKSWKGRERKRQLKLSQTVKPWLLAKQRDHRIEAVALDPWQAVHLAEELRDAGLTVIEVPQTHSSRGPRDTRLYEAVCNGELTLYDHPDVRKAAAGANAKELGNGQIFLQKASGRSRIDLLVALSNCLAEALPVKRRWRGGFAFLPTDGDPNLTADPVAVRVQQQLALRQPLRFW